MSPRPAPWLASPPRESDSVVGHVATGEGGWVEDDDTHRGADAWECDPPPCVSKSIPLPPSKSPSIPLPPPRAEWSAAAADHVRVAPSPHTELRAVTPVRRNITVAAVAVASPVPPVPPVHLGWWCRGCGQCVVPPHRHLDAKKRTTDLTYAAQLATCGAPHPAGYPAGYPAGVGTAVIVVPDDVKTCARPIPQQQQHQQELQQQEELLARVAAPRWSEDDEGGEHGVWHATDGCFFVPLVCGVSGAVVALRVAAAGKARSGLVGKTMWLAVQLTPRTVGGG